MFLKFLVTEERRAGQGHSYLVLGISKNRVRRENPCMKTMLLGMLPSLNRNLRNPMNHAPSPRRSFLILLIIACSAHLPRAQAVAPPPDGCYPGFTTAEGCDALQLLTTGDGNTANGSQALFSNTTGVGNTATGSFALSSNTGGGFNTALGRYALSNNISGSFNTVVGYNALSDNITGSENTALGFGAGLDI